MAEEAAQEYGLVLDGASRAASACCEMRQIEGRVVGQWIGLEVGPQVLDRMTNYINTVVKTEIDFPVVKARKVA